MFDRVNNMRLRVCKKDGEGMVWKWLRGVERMERIKVFYYYVLRVFIRIFFLFRV